MVTVAVTCVGTTTVSSILSDELVVRGRRSLQPSLSFLGAQPLFHSLAGGVGKHWANGFHQFMRMFVSGVAKKANVVSVPATPSAEAKMNPKPDAL